MADLTISSPLTPAAFATFTIDLANAQGVDQLRDESTLRYGFSIQGSGARAAHAKLTPIEARVLINGAPSMTIDGLIVAAAIGQGQLAQVSVDVWQAGIANNKETLTITGIITDVVWTAAQTTLGQRVDFVLQKCHRLHVRAGGSVTTSTDPGA